MSNLRDRITMTKIMNAYNKMGYKFFTDGNYNLNIGSIRANTKHVNTFDDVTFAIYHVDGEYVCFVTNSTVDPGFHYLGSPLNASGTAILVPGQYRGSHAIGLHQGKYEALRQVKNLKVWRDNDKDKELDMGANVPTETGMFGINIHRATANAGGTSTYVDKWSAGCTVIANNNDFNEFMALCRIGSKAHGNSFTYTLFTEEQVLGGNTTTPTAPPVILEPETPIITPDSVVVDGVEILSNTFSYILQAMKATGKRATRAAWNGKSLTISIFTPDNGGVPTLLLEGPGIYMLGWWDTTAIWVDDWRLVD